MLELPPFRLPTPRGLLTKPYERGRHYLRKAGTTVWVLSLAPWFRSSYPKPPVSVVLCVLGPGISRPEAETTRAALAWILAFAALRIGAWLAP